MSFMEGWDDILSSIEKQQKTYGGTSIGDSALSATGASGGFRFPDEDSAREMAQRFEDRATAIAERQELINKARRAVAERFAVDDASTRYSERAVASLDALAELNDSAKKYAEGYVSKIQSAIEAKRQNEGGIGDALYEITRQVD